MIEKIYFDYYKGCGNNEAFGQITFHDEYDEKLGVLNVDDISGDDFKLIFDLWKKHLGDDIYLEFGVL